MRISKKEAIELFSLDIFRLGKMADDTRKAFHPKEYVTFIIDRNITFTNICVAKCKFCAFFARKKSSGFLLSLEEILKRIEELVNTGGTQVMLQGGLNSDLSLSWYCNLLSSIKKRFNVWLHSLSPSEIVFLSKKEGLSIKDTLLSLKSAGLDSLPGAAEILCDRVRMAISPNKLSTDEWLNVMENAHRIGMHTTATMTFGMIETKEERVEHLIKIRSLQDKTGGFKAFIPWTFCPNNTGLRSLKQTSSLDYLKTLAISRIVLDNIPNIHSGWVTEGLGLSQAALFFGANDMGGILQDEEVIKKTGIEYKLDIKKMVSLIKNAGKIPAQRDSSYNIVKLF